ncbi:hypothetical protein Q9R34_19185 [Enterobacter sp. BRE11]|nr:hypothetical protein [Enterobacter sp. BRE11]
MAECIAAAPAKVYPLVEGSIGAFTAIRSATMNRLESAVSAIKKPLYGALRLNQHGLNAAAYNGFLFRITQSFF